MRLLRVVEIDEKGNTGEPVSCVCYHPIAEARIRRGEFAEPDFCAVEYDYQSILQEVCNALGWQGGTIHQAITEIKRLKSGVV